MKSKGFSVHIDGREKSFPVGKPVPAKVVKEFDLVAKSLVESDPGEPGGQSSGSRKRKTKPAD